MSHISWSHGDSNQKHLSEKLLSLFEFGWKMGSLGCLSPNRPWPMQFAKNRYTMETHWGDRLLKKIGVGSLPPESFAKKTMILTNLPHFGINLPPPPPVPAPLYKAPSCGPDKHASNTENPFNSARQTKKNVFVLEIRFLLCPRIKPFTLPL